MKFKVISLGCPKNLVESEFLTARLERSGHELSEEADTVIVNTCAFIADASRESVETVLQEAAEGQDKGRRVVVTGCLVERYGETLKELMPEVSLFVGRGWYGEIETIVGGEGFYKRDQPFADAYPRRVLTAKPSAYLKIQEGCDNRCTYCTVPAIRGGLVSRPVDDIAREFAWLLSKGFREINIIGQDITSYGMKGGSGLRVLLEALLAIPGDYWLRLLYMHPRGIDETLIDLIAREDRIIKYMDIPIQHSEDRILGLMGRGYTKGHLTRLFERIRLAMPEVTLRTTVIVGFPGETEEEFEALLESVDAWRFDMLGAFLYSREEGTPASKLKGHLRKGVKQKRYHRIMELQQGISRERLRRLQGTRMGVIVEREEEGRAVGRLLSQAPDIDGLAFIRGDCVPGEIREGKIVKTRDYDVIVEVE